MYSDPSKDAETRNTALNWEIYNQNIQIYAQNKT